jgi:HAD superfamily hydrolase (TIGR01490 family)
MSDEPATDTLEPPPDDLVPPPDGHVDQAVDDGRYRQMVGGGPSAAFFDLDRTLIAGSSAFIMGRTARSSGLVPTRQFVRDAGSAIVFKLRGGSDKKTDGVRDRMLGAVKGMRQDDLIALNAEVLPKLLAKIRPEARRLLDLHRRAGRSTYIVSAAPVEIVEPLALALGMTAGIGTCGEVEDGVYNGRLAGPFCYGAGKVTAMEEIARWDGLDLAQCYGYSDSASDLPMLQAVGHPVAVNPDAKLARHARANGWPIVHFSQRTKSVIRRTVAGAAATGIAAGSFAAGTLYARRR